MKKLLSIILALSMALSISSAALTASAAGGDYDVDFPDAELNEYMLKNFDANMDGKIQKSELSFTAESKYVNLNMYQYKITDLTGLENITAEKDVQVSVQTPRTVQNIAPIFESAKNSSKDASYFIYLENSTEFTNEAFSKIPRVSADGESAAIYLTLPNGLKNREALDLSPIEGYNINRLEVGGEISKGFSGKYLIALDAEEAWGDGLADLLHNTPYVLDLSVRLNYLNDFYHSDNLTTLKIDGEWRPDANVIVAEFMQNHTPYNLQHFQIYCTYFTDLMLLENLNQLNHLQLNIGGSTVGSGNVKTLGDQVLEHLPGLTSKLTSLRQIQISEYDITDLAPLETLSTRSGLSIDLNRNWISLAYKNNKKVYDKFNHDGSNTAANMYLWDQFYDIDCSRVYYMENGAVLSIEMSADKKSFVPGDTITATIKITNEGTASADFDISFYLDDRQIQWDTISVKNGGRNQSVANLAPGQSVVKTISFSVDSIERYIESLHIGALLTSDLEACGVSGPDIYSRENVTLRANKATLRDEPLRVIVRCAPDMQKAQIVAEDGTVLQTLNYNGGTGVAEDISIPYKYWPIDGAAPSQVKIKAVVTDEDGKTYSSAYETIRVMNPAENSKLKVEDCVYSPLGSSKLYHEMEPGIMYYGSQINVRAKFTVDPSEIQSASAIINGSQYEMKLIENGKYAGYYGVVSYNINEDYYDIVLSVTTKSGEVLERVIGYGRVLIDPSGIITDPNGNPIEGVKVTLQKKQEDGTWADWDAENYMQSNPVYTNEKGYYGWDVVEGTYRIIAEKEGYVKKIVERYYSRDEGKYTEITVLPPRMDVDFTMEFEDPANPPAQPMTNDTAKTAVQNTLSGMTLEASAIDADVINGLSDVITDNMYVSFKSGTYVKTASTADKSGKINGTLILENLWTTEQQEIPVNVILKTTNGEVTEPIPTTPPTPSAPVSRIKYTVSDGKTIFHMPLKGDKVLSHRLDAIVYDTEGGEHKGTTTAQVGTEEVIVDVEVDYAVKENDKVKFLDTPLKEN